jgi:DNA-directed RNA polymerase specialized sigma24 family protein
MALPERQRVVLAELLKRGDQSYLDLSRRLGLPVGSIGPTRQRAVTRLRLDPRIADLSAQYSGEHLQARSA